MYSMMYPKASQNTIESFMRHITNWTLCVLLATFIMSFVLIGMHTSYADNSGLKMLKDEIVTYVDANGMYTVGGNLKNTHTFPIKPSLELYIQDTTTQYNIIVPYNVIPANSELPFLIKIPDASANATLVGYELSGTVAAHVAKSIMYKDITLDVIYDDTLIIHDDGHLSGFAINSGNTTLYNPVIWAIVHGYEGNIVDVAYTIIQGEIKPKQTISFELYPDDSISADIITYYSCFAPSDRSVHPLTAQRGNDGNQTYTMRYESGAWLYRPIFTENGTDVTIQTTNSYPFETFASVEIPAVTQTEKFTVLRNGNIINSTQSTDETGSWHVTFEIRGRSQDVITIQGFEHGPILPIVIPEYIMQDMLLWASGQASDASMFEIIKWLADRSKLPYGMPGKPVIPQWTGTLIEWWYTEQIDEQTALNSISYMLKSGFIRLG